MLYTFLNHLTASRDCGRRRRRRRPTRECWTFLVCTAALESRASRRRRRREPPSERCGHITAAAAARPRRSAGSVARRIPRARRGKRRPFVPRRSVWNTRKTDAYATRFDKQKKTPVIPSLPAFPSHPMAYFGFRHLMFRKTNELINCRKYIQTIYIRLLLLYYNNSKKNTSNSRQYFKPIPLQCLGWGMDVFTVLR